jgi:hypothetical protein
MPFPVDFTWTAPDGCPSQAEVASDIARLRGGSEELAPLHASATVTQASAESWSVEIDTASDRGTAVRSIRGESCPAVAEATALFLALAVDRDAAAEPQLPAEAPRPEAILRRAQERAPLTPTRSPIARASLAASSRVDGGTLPRAAIGAELSAALRPRPVRLELAATYWLPQSALFEGARSVGGRFAMISASLRACYERERASFVFAPCVALDADHASGEGYGDLAAANGSTTWIGGSIGGVAAWSFTRVAALRVGVDAHVPFTRPRFFVEGSDLAHRAAAVAARAAIGVELTIP